MNITEANIEVSAWGFFIVALIFAYFIELIDRRQRLLKAQLGRLSITFQKIEHDIDTVQNSLLLIAKNDDDLVEKIARLRDVRPVILRHIVETGPNASEVLRGIDWPDPKDDPVFWEGNLADRMKLPQSLSEARGDET